MDVDAIPGEDGEEASKEQEAERGYQGKKRRANVMKYLVVVFFLCYVDNQKNGHPKKRILNKKKKKKKRRRRTNVFFRPNPLSLVVVFCSHLLPLPLS